MSAKQAARGIRLYVTIGVFAILIAGLVGGPKGLAGASLGICSGLFGIAVLWQLILLMGRAASSGAPPRFGSLITIVAFFAKLPLYAVCGLASARIGYPAFGCFLAGVVLVYSGLVAWAGSRPPAR